MKKPKKVRMQPKASAIMEHWKIKSKDIECEERIHVGYMYYDPYAYMAFLFILLGVT